MLRTILVFSLWICSTLLQAQPVNSNLQNWKSTYTKVFTTVKKYSVYRSTVNWDELEKKLLGDTALEMTFPQFEEKVISLFAEIGDNHGALFVGGRRLSASDLTANLPELLIAQLKDGNVGLRAKIEVIGK